MDAFNKLLNYFKESYSELNKVSWPSRKQARNHTIIVIALSAGVLVFFAALDWALELGIRQAILK